MNNTIYWKIPAVPLIGAFRLAIVGESKGFSMYEMCEVLGKEETLRRLDYALANIPRTDR